MTDIERVKNWAKEDFETGMTLGPDDYSTFLRICEEEDIDGTWELFNEYLDAADEARFEYTIDNEDNIEEYVSTTKKWNCYFDDDLVGTVLADTEDEALEKMQHDYPELPYSLYDGCFGVEPENDQITADTATESFFNQDFIDEEDPEDDLFEAAKQVKAELLDSSKLTEAGKLEDMINTAVDKMSLKTANESLENEEVTEAVNTDSLIDRAINKFVNEF